MDRCHSCDQLFREQQIRAYLARGNKAPDTTAKPKTVKESLRKAAHFYSMLQTEDGHWAGEFEQLDNQQNEYCS